jgi:hypothetical protein
MIAKSIKMVNQNLWYIGLAVLAAFALVNDQSFPFLGMTLVISLLATLVFAFKKEKTWLLASLYACTLFFAFFITYRANEFLTFLNIVAALISGALLTRIQPSQKNIGFLDAGMAPILSLVTSFFSTSYQYDLSSVRKSISLESFKDVKWSGLFKTVLVTLISLLIVVPLLASANPLFESWVNKLVDIFNLDFLRVLLGSETWAMWMWRAIFFTFFVYFVPRLIVFSNIRTPYLNHGLLQSLTMSVPQAVVAGIVGVFFVSQIQLYFASFETLQSLGYTNSEQAREIFGQLSVVGVLILALNYNQQSRKPVARILTIALLVEVTFLTIIALKSVADYSYLWGLTYKRLWGFMGVVWMLSAIASFSYTYFQKLASELFVKSIILLTAGILMLVNLANFDALIYRFPPSESKGTVDTRYLTTLSPDAHAYQALVTKLQAKPVEEMNSEELSWNLYQLRMISQRTTSLKEKYTHLDWQTFNFSEYWEYLDTKELNLSSQIQALEALQFQQSQSAQPDPSPPVDSVLIQN